ncbi:MAG TPA: cobalamin-dependent protein [Jiangellaceae bacterium]
MTADPRQALSTGGYAPGTLRQQLWDAVTRRDEDAATTAALTALDHGVDAEVMLLDVVAPVQRQVGTEWAANRISVAQEHAATSINDRVIAAVARHPVSRTEPRFGRVIVACVDGEWHAMPARLLAEVLRLRGWAVDFLGAQVPAPHLVAHIHQTGPDVVALSSSIPTRLPIAHAVITACQAAGAPVLVGGAAFGRDGRYARLLGADAWAPDARAAGDQMAAGIERRRRSPSTYEPVDDLPHLADEEHARVSRSASDLVKRTMTSLDEHFPAMRTYTEQQRQHTAEDIAHIVDFLATALYVDDDDLFTTFITWTADILTARGVPARSLHLGLDLLAGQLPDFPRANRILGAGRRRFDEHLADSGPSPG